jgi:hypothetical protein
MSQDQQRDTETMADRFQRMKFVIPGIDFISNLVEIDPQHKVKDSNGVFTIFFSDGSSIATRIWR